MLKLVLERGYADPELLEQLTEEQQEMLFQKIREEQIRKWKEREKILMKKEMNQPAHTERKTKIKFLDGADGNPWVWVMGEHCDDLPYEEIIQRREAEREEEEKQRARREAEELAKQEILLAETTDGNNQEEHFTLSESRVDIIDTDSTGARQKSKAMNLWQKAVDNRSTLVQNMSEGEKAAYEKRRADELYENMLKGKELSKKRAADVVFEIMEQWKKSEERAKTIELERKQSIKIAKERLQKEVVDENLFDIPEEKKKEITRKLSQKAISEPDIQDTAKSKPKFLWRQTSFAARDTKPKSMYHAIKWFKETQVPIGVGKEQDGSVCLWFHGTIDRATAEKTLIPKPAGMYLVRLSNKIWGYTISVKTYDEIKHYVVDCTTPHVYKFIGKHQPEFASLKVNPITWKGQEVLLLASEQPQEQLTETKNMFDENEEDSTLL